MQRVIENALDYRSFGDFLKADYEQRSQIREALSVRKYSQELGVDASTISQAMRQQRKLPLKQVQELGRQLGLQAHELSHFVEAEVDSGTNLERVVAGAYLKIDDWRYDAVLELLDGKAETTDVSVFASALSTTSERLLDLQKQLVDANLLARREGLWVDTLKHVTTIQNPVATDESKRSYQRSVAQSAMAAIDSVPNTLRNHTSIMLQIRPEDLPAISGLLKNTRRQIAREYQNDSHQTKELYLLQIALFPALVKDTHS